LAPTRPRLPRGRSTPIISMPRLPLLHLVPWQQQPGSRAGSRPWPLSQEWWRQWWRHPQCFWPGEQGPGQQAQPCPAFLVLILQSLDRDYQHVPRSSLEGGGVLGVSTPPSQQQALIAKPGPSMVSPPFTPPLASIPAPPVMYAAQQQHAASPS
jgi:hypothetical protein